MNSVFGVVVVRTLSLRVVVWPKKHGYTASFPYIVVNRLNLA